MRCKYPRFASVCGALFTFGICLVVAGCHRDHGGPRGGGAPSAPKNPVQPPPDAPAPPTALIGGAPTLTNAPLVTLHISGLGLSWYRAKVGPAATLACLDAAAYGPEAAAAAPLVVDQTTWADGSYRVCVLGGTASGAWQPLAQASAATWTLDRKGPGGFSVDPVEFPATPPGAVRFRWDAPLSAASVTYALGVAGPLGCAAPVATFTPAATDYTVAGGFPGGHYTVCVTAADAVGNRKSAANNGQVSFDRDATVRFAYFKGTTATAKTLMLVSRTGAAGAWHQVAVTLPPQSSYSNRATLGLAANGLPVLAYQSLEQPDLGPPQLSLGLAFGTGGDAFTRKALAPAAAAGNSGKQATLALDAAGVAHVAHVATAHGQAQLVYSRAAAADADAGAATPLEAAAAGASYSDTGLAVDAAGRLHLAYAVSGRLYYRQADAGRWDEAREVGHLDAAACADVPLAVSAVGGTASAYIAFLCTRRAGAAASCALMLADVTGMPSAWHVRSVALVDPAAGCLPFNSQRPALAVDSQGRAHLAYRYTDAAHAGQWDVAYLVGSGPPLAAPAAAFGAWSSSTGFPLVALDASDRPYTLFLTKGALQFALPVPGTVVTPETVVLDTDGGVAGEPLELSDLLVHGGRGHGYQEFTQPVSN